MNALNVDHLLKLVQFPFVELAERYGYDVASSGASLEALFWTACQAELKQKFDIDLSMRTVMHSVVISTNTNQENNELELLSHIRLSIEHESVTLQYLDSEGATHTPASSSLFLASTARRVVALGVENIEWLKKYSNAEDLFNDDGALHKWPRKSARQTHALDYISSVFKAGQTYQGSNVDQEIRFFHSDYALLRRALVSHGYLSRTKNGARYWVTETRHPC